MVSTTSFEDGKSGVVDDNNFEFTCPLISHFAACSLSISHTSLPAKPSNRIVESVIITNIDLSTYLITQVRHCC